MEVRAGQRWVTVRELNAHYFTHWRAPYTDGGDCVVPEGTIVLVRYDPRPKASAVPCQPENYVELELLIVPEEPRQTCKYDGYSLTIKLARFGTDLGLLEPTKI